MERSVRAILRAETGQYESAMGRAAQATEQVGAAAQKASRQTQQSTQQQTTAARSFSQRLVDSARQNEQAWTSVGTALLGVGAAGAGLLTVMGRVGIGYNSLRQVAVQGLTAITGSTEEAVAQMARLDEYGQTSWLMRDTLVEAQRLMTGFGIETEKVVPYIDALAEGVAAAGGSNQDFLELAEIMGQIESQGRITAEELRRFGVRGIDAAQMIGDAMGMTAGEIREQITSGALDAQTALDALAAGMIQNFEGSSDLVRDTFRGAVDDVVAAFRDLSAGAMGFLVDPEGGGLLVGLMNNVADFIRTLEGLPDPVLNAGIVITGLGTAATLAGGAFLVAFPKALRLADSLAELGMVSPRVGEAMRTMGPRIMRVGRYATGAVIGVVALGNAVQGIQDHFRDAALGANELERAMRQQDFDAAFSRLSGSYNSLQDAWDRLTGEGAIDRLDRWMSSINQALGGHLPDDIAAAAGEFEAMGEVLAALVSSGNADLAAEMFANLANELDLTADQHEILMGLLPGYADALAGVANATDDAADGTGELAGGLEEIDPAAFAAQQAIEALTDTLAEASTGFVDIMGAWDAVIDKNRELADESAAASGDAAASWEDFYDGHSVSISDYLDELQSQVDAQREWEANMTVLAGRVSQGTLDELGKLGPEGAPLIAALVDASDEELDRFEDLMAQGSQDAGEAFATSLIEAIPLIRAAMTEMSDEAIAELAERLRSGETTIQDEIEQWNLDGLIELPVDVDTEPARSGFEDVVDDWGNTVTTTGLDLDDEVAVQVFDTTTRDWGDTITVTSLDLDESMGVQVFNETTGMWENTTSTTLLDLDDDAAVLVFDRTTGQWVRTTTATALDLDDRQARRAYNAVTDSWERDTTTTNLDANDAPARATVRSLGGWASNYTVSVNVSANVAAAQARIRSLNQQRVQIGADLIRYMGGPVEHRAGGGRVVGPGTGTSDSIPALGPMGIRYRLSNGEHIWTDAETRAVGGHDAMYALRAMAKTGALRALLDGAGYAGGGTVGSPAYQYRPTFSAPQVTVRAPSLDGLRIVGTLDLGDGLEGRIDGRIAASMSGTRRSARALTGGGR